jgi:nitrate/nitrite transporter NarK
MRTFTSNTRRKLVGGLLLAIVLTGCGGCQTFSLSDEDFQKQQKGQTIDPKTGDAVGVVGTLGYYGAVLGEFIAAATGK